jgi:hypothetical protein
LVKNFEPYIYIYDTDYILGFSREQSANMGFWGHSGESWARRFGSRLPQCVNAQRGHVWVFGILVGFMRYLEPNNMRLGDS